MKDELDCLRAMPYEDRIRETGEENKTLRIRNGELLVEVAMLRDQVAKLKDQTAHLPTQPRSGLSEQMAHLQAAGLVGQGQVLPPRPQTAQIRSGLTNYDVDQLLKDPNFDLAQEEDDLDQELNELMAKNQKQLEQLHSEFKQVSKMADEPVISIRKIKQPLKIKKRLEGGD